MKSFLDNFLNWFSPKRRWTLIFIAIAFKFLSAVVFAQFASDLSPDLMVDNFILKHPDYNYFLQPVDNFFEEGHYYFKEGSCYAGRMPGYWIIYGGLRTIFSKSIALYGLILLQIILSGISVYILALISSKIFASEKVFSWTYLLFLMSSFTSVFDFQTVSESFSIPAFIFSLWFFIKYWLDGDQKIKNLILSGLFLTWTIFLRPYAGIFLLIFGLFILWNERKNIKSLIKYALIFSLPFLLIEGAWIARNYRTCGEFIPLQQKTSEAYGKNYSDGWIAARTLIHAWGEGGEYFEPNSVAEWFKLKDIPLQNQLKEDYFKNVSYCKEDIVELKNKYHRFYETEGYDRYLDQEIITLSNDYRKQFKKGNPFKYFITQRWNAFKRLFFHSGSSYIPLPPFSQMTWGQKTIKIFFSGWYYLVLICGFFGILFTSEGDKNLKSLLIFLLTSLVLTLIYLSTIQEARYLIMGYIILCLFAARALSIFKERFIG